MKNDFAIVVCPAQRRADALRLLHEGLADDQRNGLIAALDGVRGEGEAVFEGLFIACDGRAKLQGVCWVQAMPGCTAVVWPPADSSPAAAALMLAASERLDRERVVLAQVLVSPDGPANIEVLEAADFQKLADLAYLTVDQSHFPPIEPESGLKFEPYSENNAERLGKLIKQTYTDSLDCPGLNNVRHPDDVVAGYAAQNGPGEMRWFFVRHDDRDVGVLILATHSEGDVWELVYMGVVPTARGSGLGQQILRYALWQARVGKAQRLVLAVDELNHVAMQMYRESGLVQWDRRTVYARIRSG